MLISFPRKIDTRMTDLDYRTKMEQVLTTRRNIHNVSETGEHCRGSSLFELLGFT